MADSTLHYRLTNDEWVQAVQELRPAERDVLYYIRTLDPFGDRDLDIGVREIARKLGYDASTVSRALKTLDAKQYIDLQLLQVRVRIRDSCGKVLSTDNTVASTQQSVVSTQQSRSPDNKVDRQTTPTPPHHQLEPLQDSDFKNSPCTNNRSNCLNKQKQKPLTHPVFEELNREELGTSSQDPLEQEVSALLTLVQDSGIRANGTIQETIVSLVFQQGSAAARRIVENSVSAVVEQQKKGNCRNPGGMLVTGLRRGFTANTAKRDARERKEPQTEVFGFPVAPPSFNQVAAAIDQALLKGDRPFALEKLRSLWGQGFHDLVEELVATFKRDWQFRITNQGVQDAHAT